MSVSFDKFFFHLSKKQENIIESRLIQLFVQKRIDKVFLRSFIKYLKLQFLEKERCGRTGTTHILQYNGKEIKIGTTKENGNNRNVRQLVETIRIMIRYIVKTYPYEIKGFTKWIPNKKNKSFQKTKWIEMDQESSIS